MQPLTLKRILLLLLEFAHTKLWLYYRLISIENGVAFKDPLWPVFRLVFGGDIRDFSNALQERILNQRKADKLGMLMKKLVYLWQEKI